MPDTMKRMFFLAGGLSCFAFLADAAQNQPVNPAPKPVPRMQAIPLPDHQISFQRDGVELARYHFDPTSRRPFVFPVNGPSGRSLTRMGHPHDPESHSHHNSVWISHNDVNGVSFWDDRAKGRIVHQRIERFDDSDNAAALLTVNLWLDDKGKALLTERRLTQVQTLPANEWLLIIDLQFEAKGDPVTLGKTPFGLVGVRMARTVGVNDGGGTIRNSGGGINEPGVFWKPARWVDYSGPITATATEGITLMDHPSNPNHPTIFHVRNDGWMGASFTHQAPRTIEPAQPLRLRYGLYVHAGLPDAKVLDQRWEEFSRSRNSFDSVEKK
jgi:hypothetical protein